MPGWSMINGVWRELWNPTPNINGVVRDSNIFTKINGVTRTIYSATMDPSDIIGFRMVYMPADLQHPKFPYLKYNGNIPAYLSYTGGPIKRMDTTSKGVILHYTNEKWWEEGTIAWEGKLYAQLMNGEIVDVVNSKDTVGSDERVPTNIPGSEQAWLSSKIMGFTILMNYTTSYNAYGFQTFGWNSMFNVNEFIDESKFSDRGPNKKDESQNSYNILPTIRRSDMFDSVARIGIARDMNSKDDNMIGSYGTMSQDIHSIRLNGEIKPFIVELYH